MILRDLRSKEIRILIMTALCAVICTTSILFTISSIELALYNVSSALVGGDRVISAPTPIKQEIHELAKKLDLHSTNTVTFYSMLSTEQDLVLASVKSVEDNYPLRGELQITTGPEQSSHVADYVPTPGTIWLEGRALALLNTKVGQDITVGATKLKIAAILTQEPDRVADGLTFAPRALINAQDLPATGAVLPGGRVNYKLLLVGTAGSLSAFDQELPQFMQPEYKLRDSASRDTRSMRTMQQAERYLGLAILVNIILSAVAITIVTVRYSISRIPDVAILRCMGATSRQIIRMYIFSLTLVAVIIGMVGSTIGFIIQQILTSVLGQYMQQQIPWPGATPLLFGLSCSILLIVGIALPQIIRLGKIAPIQILRQSNLPLPMQTLFAYIILSIIMVLLLYWQVPDLKLVNGIVMGMLLTIASTFIVLYFLFKILDRASKYLPALLSLSVHNIFYNARNNIIQVMAFALIICVGALLYISRSELLNTWQKQLPSNTPNYFVINVDSGLLPGLQQYLSEHAIKAESFYPIVRGTLSKINQEIVSQDEGELGKRNGLNRALNLTWTQQLPADNKVIAGTWFTDEDVGKPILSVEQQVAERLDIKLGDELTFVINGKEVAATITSIRSVQWDNFQPNFYVVYPAGLLREEAYSYMTSFYVDQDQEQYMLELAQKFPSISLISASVMLDYANSIIKLLSLVIAYIWMFSMIVVILLLSAVVLSSLPQRNYQTNLMRILGSSKRQILSILVGEFMLLGAVSGMLGVSIATGMAKYVTGYIFHSSYPLNWYIMFIGAGIGSLIMLATGLLGTNRALKSSPVQLSLNLN